MTSSTRNKMLLSSASLLLSLGILELAARVVLGEIEVTKYGWSTPEETTQQRRVTDTANHVRDVTAAYGRHGFKRWGDIDTDKRKILVLGDSFTESPWVENGEEYYAYLETGLDDVELFVHGAGGYGSLQEYMILDDHIDVIEPDLILWQFCGNDYSNNYYDHDAKSYPDNNRHVRPYLEGGRVVYRYPGPVPWLRTRLRSVAALETLYGDLIHGARRPARDLTEERVEAFQVTSRILSMVRERAGDTPIFLFQAYPEMTPDEERLCSEAGITCIPGVSEHIARREAEGVQVRLDPWHWNTVGSRIVGEFLVDYFEENRVFERRSER